MSSTPRIIHARWVVPVSSPPIRNGYAVTLGGFIVKVGRGQPDVAGEIVDLGAAILLPGLINAHTHLWLSDLQGSVPFNGSFVGWIEALLSASAGLKHATAFRRSLESGWNESLRAGVTTVADIGFGSASIDAWRDCPIRVFGFVEVLGMGPRRFGGHAQSVDQAVPAIRRAATRKKPALLGLSPHAPYSTDPIVYKNALLTYMHLCTHLAETKEEARFLRDGTGPFRHLLEAWNLWDGSFQPPGCSPVSYMRQLGVLRPDANRFFPPILAHVNYVDDSDLAILAECKASVAFCPRTHAFFRHEPHRYRDMHARGINVCLGTDSLASNHSLSMLDEVRFLRSIDHKSSDEVLLQMATTNGAKALGRPDVLGSLDRGRWADLIAVPLEHPGTSKPLEDLLRGEASPSHAFVHGKLAWQASSR